MKDILLDIGLTVLVMGLVACLLGLLIAIASRFFHVKKDEREEAISAALPGGNCGACGYSGCSAYASAIVNDGAPVNKCSVGGQPVADAISEIMGVSSEGVSRMRAQVMCSGTFTLATQKYEYRGLADCGSVFRLGNGPRECAYGCIGLGTCVKACPFDAIKIENGVAVVEYEKCMGCGLCVSACPQHIIDLVPFDTDVWVGCRSKDKGPTVKNYCRVGCIGCNLCVKTCKHGAISVVDNVARIDYSKCVNCGDCVEKCPRKIIWSGKVQVDLGDTFNDDLSIKEDFSENKKKMPRRAKDNGLTLFREKKKSRHAKSSLQDPSSEENN